MKDLMNKEMFSSLNFFTDEKNTLWKMLRSIPWKKYKISKFIVFT